MMDKHSDLFIEMFGKALCGEISTEDFLIEVGVPPDMARALIEEVDEQNRKDSEDFL